MFLFIVFGSKEYADNHIFGLLAVNIDLVGERLVGESLLAGDDFEVVFVEFIFIDIQGVGDFKIELVEVGIKLVNADTLNLDSRIAQVGISVVWEVAFVLHEVESYPLVELVEHWVTKSGFEVLQSAWDEFVLIDGVGRIAKDLVGQNHEVAVEASVWGIWA